MYIDSLVNLNLANEHLTYDPWIWLKVTFMSSTASVLKDDIILLISTDTCFVLTGLISVAQKKMSVELVGVTSVQST